MGATVQSRTKNGTGCPYCSGNRVSHDNNLKALHAEIAKQWHPTKNGTFTPEDYTARSSKKVWWLCDKDHEWQATIGNRTGNNSGCPVCAGKKASSDRNLQVQHPEVASQWHPTRNGNKKPSDFTHGSHTKVWWLCEQGHFIGRYRIFSKIPFIH